MIETLMGLNVTDRELYAQYRAQMTPLLTACGGSFGIDLWVAEVLLAPTSAPFNRVFTIHFPSQEVRDAFFSNPEYRAINQKFFQPSVANRSVLGHFTVLESSAH